MGLLGRLYYMPPWFYGYDIVLQLLFGIIALVVSFYAFRLYRVSVQRELKLFSGAFFFISLSYLIWATLNIFLISQLDSRVSAVEFEEFKLLTGSIFGLSTLGVYAHIFFFITGVLTLAFMTFGVDSPKIYVFLVSLVLPILFFSGNIRLITYLIAAILFAYISLFYLKDFINQKNGKTLLVLLAFILLFFASLTFMYSGRDPLHYAIGHILTFIAYLFILINFIKVLHYGQKKKQT